MASLKDRQRLTPWMVVVAAGGGALIANWIHAGWLSGVIGSVIAVALVAYGTTRDS